MIPIRRVCREDEKSVTNRTLMRATHTWDIDRLALLSCGTNRLTSLPFGSAKDQSNLGATSEWTVVLEPTEIDFTLMPKKAQAYLWLVTGYPGPVFFKAELRSLGEEEDEDVDEAAIETSLRNLCSSTNANGAQRVESIRSNEEIGIGTVEIPEVVARLRLRVDIAYFNETSKTVSRARWYTEEDEDEYPFGTLLADIENMMLDEDADVVLVDAEGKEHKAHKAILIARSPVFRAMFKSDMLESQSGRVNIADVSGEALKQMITYMYTDKVNNDSPMPLDTLAVANRYQLPRLKYLCEQGLILTSEDAITILAAANLHEAKSLKKAVLKFVSANMTEVMASAAWKKATPDLLRQIIEVLASKCDDLARRSLPREDDDK